MKKIVTVLMLCLMVSSVYAYDVKAVEVEKLAKSTKSWNGDLLPKFPDGQPEVTILKITIQPGVKLPMHAHPVYNAGVLLEGQLTVITKDGKTLNMKAGDPIIEVVNTWHYGVVKGDKPAVIIVFYVGKEGEKLTVKE
jgi:quercetin dioxygenase-like cupin family protein